MKNIAEAERLADERIAAAKQYARTALAAAEERAADIADDTRESIKLRSRAFTEQAENAARAESDALIREGRKQAERLAAGAAAKTEEAAERVARRIANGDR